MNSKGAKRTTAKLFLNNLYGKFATSPNSSYKIGYIDSASNALRFNEVEESKKKTISVAIGSAITSYARAFTIKAAQANYHGAGRGFIYADTDSIHCDLTEDEIVGVPEDPVKFNHWKYEAGGDFALYVRSKTYLEHTTRENRKVVEPYYNMKCAGMPQRARDLFIASVLQDEDMIKRINEDKELTDHEREFLAEKREFSDFKIGLRVPGCLKAHRVTGGTVLFDSDFVMRKNADL